MKYSYILSTVCPQCGRITSNCKVYTAEDVNFYRKATIDPKRCKECVRTTYPDGRKKRVKPEYKPEVKSFNMTKTLNQMRRGY